MTIRWCICDIDGTLLDRQNNVSQDNADAVKRLQDTGIQFILATGRPDFWVQEIVDRLHVCGPLIACNGAVIRNLPTRQLLRYDTLGEEIVLSIIEHGLANDLDLLAYTSDTVYYTPGSHLVNVFHEYNRSASTQYYVPTQRLTEDLHWPAKEVVKFLVRSRQMTHDPKFAELLHDQRISATSSRSGVTDIMAKGVSKGSALGHLAGMCSIDLTQTVVLGDNFNDISMFEIAAFGIAMGNAEAELKIRASFTTRSNDENGVAFAIDQWILKRNE